MLVVMKYMYKPLNFLLLWVFTTTMGIYNYYGYLLLI